MLVSAKEILMDAHKNGYAVGSFAVSNMETVQAVIAAAVAEKSPVILQTSEGAVKYAGLEYILALVRVSAENSQIPIALHLNHGKSYESIARFIASGYTSVMIDAFRHSFEEYISITRDVVRLAHACGVSVEAGFGRLTGSETGLSEDEASIYDNPDRAKNFLERTGADSMAIDIKTAQGKTDTLNFDRLDTIKKLLNCPLVLHGASGLAPEQLQKAVKLGVSKINVDVELRQAFTDAIRGVLERTPQGYDPRVICGPARDAMKEVVVQKIRLFGSFGKA